jgi:AraC-like DNA-binding protein
MAGMTRDKLRTFFRYFAVSERDRRWGLHVNTAGEAHIPPAFDYPPAGHPGTHHFDWEHGRVLHEYQVVYISAGQGVLEIGRTAWRIDAGSAMMVFPRIRHRYRPDRETGWHEHWVGCDGPVVRDLASAGFFSPRKPVVRIRDEDLLLGAYTSLLNVVRADPPAFQQVAAGLALYILALVYSAQQPALGGASGVAAALREGLRRMADPQQEEVPLPQVARQLGVSYTRFRRLFSQHVGLSPHQYRLQLKIGRARRLLSDTKLPVKEIAFRAGFESEQYFCRLFKRKTGLTPSQWRCQLP